MHDTSFDAAAFDFCNSCIRFVDTFCKTAYDYNNVKKKFPHENMFIDETHFCSVSLLYLYGIDGEKRE